jgi:poly(3-hydroxybutyrate) depolymerase
MNATCNASAFDESCCYASCRPGKVGQCGGDGAAAACSWSTCVDDAAFVAALLESLGAQLCVDLDAVYVTGGSNGGMLTHWLYARLPTAFAALVPVYGLPLAGFAEVPSAAAAASIMALHDRSDEIIPEAGGYADGWIYETSDKVYSLWASLKQCQAEPVAIAVPFPSAPNANLACREYLGCASGRVVRCLYDGHHGDGFRDMAAMTWWFLNQTKRQAISSAVSRAAEEGRAGAHGV